ncbi:MAG: hypothetical protein R3B90_14595 [Planctomycetaceae bacterium]
MQLAEYGSRLDAPLQYSDEPPFQDFYHAHMQFFKVLLNKGRDEGLAYFREQLDAEPDERDRPLLAYVLVDLLMRSGRLQEAVDLAAEALTGVSEEVTGSLIELCLEADRMPTLREVMRRQEDPVLFAAVLLSEQRSAKTAAPAPMNG